LPGGFFALRGVAFSISLYYNHPDRRCNMSFEMLKKEGFVTLLSKNEASGVRGGEHPWDEDGLSPVLEEGPWDVDVVKPLPK